MTVCYSLQRALRGAAARSGPRAPTARVRAGEMCPKRLRSGGLCDRTKIPFSGLSGPWAGASVPRLSSGDSSGRFFGPKNRVKSLLCNELPEAPQPSSKACLEDRIGKPSGCGQRVDSGSGGVRYLLRRLALQEIYTFVDNSLLISVTKDRARFSGPVTRFPSVLGLVDNSEATANRQGSFRWPSTPPRYFGIESSTPCSSDCRRSRRSIPGSNPSSLAA